MRASLLCFALAAACLVLLPAAQAQRPGGGGAAPAGGGGMGQGGSPGGGAGGNGGYGGAMPGGINSSRDPDGSLDTRGALSTVPAPGNSISTIHNGLQLGPPGRWWDDKHFAKSVRLRSDQQKRMDGIFDENKTTLVSRFQTLQQEEAKMDALSHAESLDENALFAQIDHVAQARANLEKAYTHVTLQVRKEMDADQITRLDKFR